MERTQPSIALVQPWISDQAVTAAAATLGSGWWGYGPRCAELEALFCRSRSGWSLATQSCTAALWTAAMLLKSHEPSEIIIPANTYVACAAAFQIAGWRVRICDIDPETGLLDLEDAARHVSAATRALLVVDTYGQRFPEHAAREFCRERELFLIRDAAHRLDLDRPDEPEADFVCYSFGPTKEVAGPDGGLLWSNASHLEDQARALTLWGIANDTWLRTRSSAHSAISVDHRLGLKLRLTDVSAAIILAQLPDLPGQRLKRRALVETYSRMRQGEHVQQIKRDKDDSCLMAPVLVDPRQRHKMRDRLAAQGISTSDHYPNLARLLPGTHLPCPRAEHFCSSVISLPMHLHLSQEQAERVASCVHGDPN